jgi:glycosyltransferase involved in cell wall biosynthesis
LRLSQTLRKSNADVFHIVASHEWNPLLAFFIKLMQKPFVFTIHDPEHHLGTPFYMKISDAITALMADLIIVLSRLGREQLIKKGHAPNMIRQIPIGVYSFFSRHALAPVAQEKMILFFGRIEPYKGLNILLKAFRQVSDSLSGWKLVIAGNGDMSEYASLANHAQVEVINRYVGDEEVLDLMQRARFVILPYTEATQSGVIPIAYAFARAVIATDVGSLSETVQNGGTGLLIQPNDVDKLAQAILTLTGDAALCRRMGQAAYEFANTELAWEKIAKTYIAVYSEVLQ